MTYKTVKAGLNAWTLGGWRLNLRRGLDSVIEVAAELGYDGVELVYDDANYSPDRIDKQERKRLAEHASSHDISIPSVATAVFWRYSLASPDDTQRNTALDYLKKGLEMAADLNAETLLVVPAVAKEGVGYRKTYDYALSSIKTASHWAEDLNVKIGLENVWNRFLYDPLIYAKFIEEVGSEYVGLYFDVGNVLELAPFEHWIEVLGSRIVMVHVKDYDMNSRGPGGFRLVGQGSVDWRGFIQALRSVGYDGFLNVETPPEFMKPLYAIEFPRDGVEAARSSLQALRSFIS